MHKYSIDKGYRQKVILIIISIAFIVNKLLYEKVECFISRICLKEPFLLDISNFLNSFGIETNLLSVLTLFGLLYWLYKKHVWKLFKKFHSVPDLSGKWEGKLVSSYINEQGEHTEKDIKMTINQDWDKISIKSEFGTSYSYSDTASICIDDNKGITLIFTYTNQAKKLEWDSNMHIGCNIFRVTDDNSMNGYYFTRRGKSGTNGTIELKRVK